MPWKIRKVRRRIGPGADSLSPGAYRPGGPIATERNKKPYSAKISVIFEEILCVLCDRRLRRRAKPARKPQFFVNSAKDGRVDGFVQSVAR